MESKKVEFGVYQVQKDKHGDKILFVADLIQLLQKCNPTDQVIISTGAVSDVEFCNVESMELPNDEQGVMGFTLNVVDTFDPRQF